MRALASIGLALVALILANGTASAHPLAPSVLTLEQAEEGKVTLRWRAPIKRPTGQSLRPRVPVGCEVVGAVQREVDESETAVTEVTELRCTPPSLEGIVVGVDGLDDSSINVVVRLVRPDGDVHHAILDTGRPALTIGTPDAESRSFLEYLELGVEHLLTGWDHLIFVLGLLILFGWQRRLIAAVTAFTLGHSLTLALSVLGIVSVPQSLVEALIALTIVVLALEIQFGEEGPVYRHPWTLPGFLGLLHGLGFASVLFEAGLPTDEIPLALLGFNLGIELGQLGVIALAWGAFFALRWAIPGGLRSNRTIPAYFIGSLAAYWTIERTLSALGVVF